MTPNVELRAFHIAVGVIGLILGPVVMRASKSGSVHPRLGNWYFLVITASCGSAAVMAISDWARSSIFFWVAIGTYAYAVVGYLAAKKRPRGWLLFHVIGVTSSYCGLVMAFLVNNLRKIPALAGIPYLARLFPLMFISTCIVVWVGVQVQRGVIPRR